MTFPITRLARINAGLHVTALTLSSAFIRPGSTLVPLSDRLAYLAASSPGWAITWTVWAACALAMVSFAFVVAHRIGTRLAKLGLGFAVVAAISDLVCDEYFVVSVPLLASNAGSGVAGFLHVERLVNLVSLSINNTLYSISTLLLTLALRGRPGVARGTVHVGVAAFVVGMLLTAAGLSDVPEFLLWTTPPTIGLYCAWVLLVARSLESEPDAPARV